MPRPSGNKAKALCIQLSAKANRLLELHAAASGITRTSIFELALREYHRHHKADLPKPKAEKP